MHVNAKAKTSGLVSISVFFSIISLFCISFSINEGKILRSHVCTDRSKLDTLMLYSPIVVVLDIHIVVNGRTRVRYSYLVNGRTRVRRIHVHHALKRGAVKICAGRNGTPPPGGHTSQTIIVTVCVFLRISIRFSNWIIGSLDASRAAATTDLCLIFLCKVASRDLTYR